MTPATRIIKIKCCHISSHQAGYDPRFGARPLRRAVQQHVLNPLARLILDGGVRDGEAVRVRRLSPPLPSKMCAAQLL